MSQLRKGHVDHMVEQYGSIIPGLKEQLKNNIEKEFEVEDQPKPPDDFLPKSNLETIKVIVNTSGEVGAERIIVTTAGARPVAKISSDKVTTEFLGKNTENSPWKEVIVEASERLNKCIPAVGRIELKNGDAQWVGTGWMIDEGIIVTNAHVAEVFAETDTTTASFVFKPGFSGGKVSARIDFLEEESSNASIEHPITSVLWIAPADETDVAFLVVEKGDHPGDLPKPVELADSIEVDNPIAAIGYPARDESIRDQDLVISIFGSEVYDKKRLAPGRLKKVEEERFEHDCSTLGGNSGSLVVDIKTGKAVGLHQGGFLDDSANLGVTISHLKKLLHKVKNRNMAATENKTKDDSGSQTQTNQPSKGETNEIKLNIQIPLEVTIKMGQVVSAVSTNTASAAAGSTSTTLSIDAALDSAKAMLSFNPDVIRVRKGYRFKNGWITDEKVVVIEVKEKLEFKDLVGTGKKPFPREINGVGVDVRTASLSGQLEQMKVEVVVAERKGKPAGYEEPEGYDDPNTDMYLKRVREKMDATFHVSPDEGFKNLSAFIERTQQHLTATIYEWEPNHISDVIENVMQGNKTLTMVTQRNGVGGSDATISAVEDMQDRIGDKFSHVWASTNGKKRLIPGFYHIKVACRDGEEFWLSSGNWKSSNQPKNPTKFSDLTKYNREWHAIIKNEELTGIFQRYIEYDFQQATEFPTEFKESIAVEDPEFIVPLSAFISSERIRDVDYTAELNLQNEFLDIQPLLTPDLDAEGDRIFIKHATNMIRRATQKIYLQNQSFTMTDDNNEELDEFFETLQKKQRAIGDVRIIMRDARDYPSGYADQIEVIERLKDFGFDTSPKSMRLQSKCHTKGIIVDSKEVLLGSQNITNGGMLFNRDASLLVRNRRVAEFFESVFLFDWDNLTYNKADERVGGIRRAEPGEVAKEGFVKVKLSDLLNQMV